MQIEQFTSWLAKAMPNEAPKAQEHVNGLSKIESLLRIDLDQAIKGQGVQSIIDKVTPLLGGAGAAASKLGGGMLGGLLSKAASSLVGKIDIKFLLGLYQKFMASQK